LTLKKISRDEGRSCFQAGPTGHVLYSCSLATGEIGKARPQSTSLPIKVYLCPALLLSLATRLNPVQNA